MHKLNLEKAEEPENQIANSRWIMEKAKEFQKNIYFYITGYAKAFDWIVVVIQSKALAYPMMGIVKEVGIPDHLTCLLRNLYEGQEEKVRARHGTTD